MVRRSSYVGRTNGTHCCLYRALIARDSICADTDAATEFMSKTNDCTLLRYS